MERLGKYEIRSVLGRGAMGTVYEGWDPVISRRVAIKTVRLPSSDDSEEREQLGRFQQEAQAAGRLQHPAIVGVFDYAETGELAYIVMEFVEGRTLKAFVDGGARPGLPEIGRLMDGLLTGLAYSHRHGVIHRDIKPANIIVTPAGQVKIADFGIARIESSTMTQAGSIMGTPAYMSPEQFQGVSIDTRTDIYSAGVVLFQLLTGKRPFEGSMATIMHAVLNNPAPAPSALAPEIPSTVDAVVARAMARAPADRYPDAAAFNQALQSALLPQSAPRSLPVAGPIPDGLGDLLGDDPTIITAHRPKPAEPKRAPETPMPKPQPRARQPLVLASVGALLAAAAGTAFWTMSGPAKPVQPSPTVVATTEPPPSPIRPVPREPVMVPPAEPTPPPKPAQPPPVLATPTPPTAPPVTPAPPVITPPPIVPPIEPAVTAPPATEPPKREQVPAIAAPESVPIVTALATPSPEMVRRAVAAALRTAPCSFATGDERGPAARPTLRGTAGDGGTGLRSAVQDAAPGQVFDWQMAEVNDRYCAVLDLLRPYARPFGATGRMLLVGLADGRTELQDGELVRPRLVLPDGPSFLQLDYLASDGTALHMHSSKPGSSYPTDAAPGFGDPKPPGFNGWGIEGPFGTELIIAVVTSAPLFRANQALPETTEAYLRELRASLAQLTRTGARVTAFVLPIRTRPKS